MLSTSTCIVYLDRIPAEIRVADREERRVQLNTTAREPLHDELEVRLTEREHQLIVVHKGEVGHVDRARAAEWDALYKEFGNPFVWKPFFNYSHT